MVTLSSTVLVLSTEGELICFTRHLKNRIMHVVSNTEAKLAMSHIFSPNTRSSLRLFLEEFLTHTNFYLHCIVY
jgi:hypothetical protein